MFGLFRSYTLRFASGWTFAIFGAAALAVVLTVNLADFYWTLPGFKQLTLGVGILDMEWHYDANEAYRILAAQGEAGRSRYLKMLWTVDVALPLLVSLWLLVTVVLALRRLETARRTGAWLMLLPLAAGLSDYFENSGISILLAYYPERLDMLAGALGYITLLKHSLYALSFITVLALWLGTLGRRWPSKEHKSTMIHYLI